MACEQLLEEVFTHVNSSKKRCSHVLREQRVNVNREPLMLDLKIKAGARLNLLID